MSERVYPQFPGVNEMPRSMTIALSLCALALAAGCAGRAAPAGAPPRAEIPASALVYYDNSGGIQDSLRLVVRDAVTMRDVWRRATSTQSSPPPLPTVDFAREMVVVVGTGRMTPADEVRVDSLAIREQALAGQRPSRVMELVVHTIRGCQTIRADAYPLAIMRVQRFDGEVRFVERRQRADGCAGASAAPLPRSLARGSVR